MSRRSRTTAKLFGNNHKQGGSKPGKDADQAVPESPSTLDLVNGTDGSSESASTGEPLATEAAPESPSTLDLASGTDGSSEPASTGEPLTTEALERHLAAEALLREESEERTASTISRYFKMTLALAGINLVVAGAIGIVLLTRSHAVQTVTIQPAKIAPAAPPPAQPTSPNLLEAAPPAERPSVLPAASPAPLPAALPPAETSPRRLAPAATKRTFANLPRTPRVTGRSQTSRSEDATKEADRREVVLSSVVERW